MKTTIYFHENLAGSVNTFQLDYQRPNETSWNEITVFDPESSYTIDSNSFNDENYKFRIQVWIEYSHVFSDWAVSGCDNIYDVEKDINYSSFSFTWKDCGEVLHVTANSIEQPNVNITAKSSPTSGGNVSGSGTYDKGANVTLTATQNIGYNFTGWYKSGSQISTDLTYSFIATGNATYTAQFSTAETLTLNKRYTINLRSGSEKVYYKFTPSVSTQYIFEAYSTGSIYDSEIHLYDSNKNQITYHSYNDDGEDNHFKFTEDLNANTLYYIELFNYGDDETGTFQFQASLNQHTITYDANGGSVSPTSQTVNAGSSTTTPTAFKNSTTTSRTVSFNANGGTSTKTSQSSSATVTYSSNGWYTSSSGGAWRADNGKAYVPTQSERLYAQWKASTGSYSSITFPSTTQCTRTGYTLLGFSTSQSATAATYNPGASAVVSGTWYAVWTPNSYTYNITYQSTTGVFLGSGTVTKNFGSTYSISPNQNFTGYTTPSAQNITWDSILAKTIIFKYTPINYTIEYNLKGGSASNKTSYNIETTTFTLNNPTKTGNTFKGWSGTDLTGETNTSVKITTGSTGNRTYTANWTVNSYQFTLGSATHVNTTGSTTSGSKQYGSTITLKATVDTGYSFDKWTSSNTNLVSNKTVANTSFDMPAGNLTMTPSIKANSYTITYDISTNANSGDVLLNQPADTSYTYTGGNVKITTDIPKREGYTFIGWCRYSNSISDILNSGDLISQPTNNITLYAVWKKTISITYDINKGTGALPEPPNSKDIYNTTTSVTFNLTTTGLSISREGHSFAGWSKTKGGTTAVGSSITVSDNTTLYAIWKVNQYTITPKFYTVDLQGNVTQNNSGGYLYFEDGTQFSSVKSFNYGDTIKVYASPYSGYAFSKWGDINSAFNPREITIPAQNIEISAYFTVKNKVLIIKHNSSSLDSDVIIWIREKNGSDYGDWIKIPYNIEYNFSQNTTLQMIFEHGENYEFDHLSTSQIGLPPVWLNSYQDYEITGQTTFTVYSNKREVCNNIYLGSSNTPYSSGYIKNPNLSFTEEILSIWVGNKQIMGKAPINYYPYIIDTILGDTLYIGLFNSIEEFVNGRPMKNTIAGHAYNKIKFNKIVMSDNITIIKDQAFYESNAEHIILSKNLQELNRIALGYGSYKTLNIPKNMLWKDLGSYTVKSMFEKFLVHPDNPYYSSDSHGVLYNKNKTTLLIYPYGKKNDSYTLNFIEGKLEEGWSGNNIILKHLYYKGTKHQWETLIDYPTPFDDWNKTYTIHCIDGEVFDVTMAW